MHEQFKCHDACSNAVRLSSIEVQIHKIGLSIEFLTKKTPKFEKPLEQFVINWLIDHHTWEKTDKDDQLHQYNKPISSIKPIWNKIPNSGSIQALEILIYYKTPNWSN